jgi:hypothetical protein
VSTDPNYAYDAVIGPTTRKGYQRMSAAALTGTDERLMIGDKTPIVTRFNDNWRKPMARSKPVDQALDKDWPVPETDEPEAAAEPSTQADDAPAANVAPATPRGTIVRGSELKAIATIQKLLDSFDTPTRRRILNYVADFYAIPTGAAPGLFDKAPIADV